MSALLGWDVATWSLITGAPVKSRLVSEFLNAVQTCEQDVTIVRASADEARRFVAWSMLGAAVRNHIGLRPGDGVESARQRLQALVGNLGLETAHVDWLAYALGFRHDGEIAGITGAAKLDERILRDQVMGALGDVFSRLSAQTKVLLILEDVHRGDAASLECVDVLVHRLTDSPLAVVMTGREQTRRVRPELFDAPALHCTTLHELSKKSSYN